MIANFDSQSHLNDDHRRTESFHIPSLQLELYPQPQSEEHCAEVQSEKVKCRAAEGKGGREELLKLIVMVRLESMGYRTSRLNSAIDQELLQIDPYEPISQIQISRIVSRVVPDGNNAQKDTNSKKRIRKFTRQSSALTNSQQNNKVQSQRIPQQATTLLLCPICINHSHKYYQGKCKHSFCNECFKQLIRQNINDGNFIVQCPEQNCETVLQPQQLSHFLQQHQYQKFIYFYGKTMEQGNNNNKFCSKPDCGSILQLLDDRLNCKSCKVNYCVTCLQHYHQDSNCDTALRESLELIYQTFNIKKCPKCSSPIEKEFGCNHIRCHKCHHQFCWICLKKYTNCHYKNYNCFGCPGMQFEDEGDLACQRILKCALLTTIPFIATIMLLCFIAAVPIYMVGNIIGKPFSWINDKCEFVEAIIIQKSCCFLLRFDCGDFVCSFLLWVLYQPRALIFAIFVAPFRLASTLYAQIQRLTS